MELTEQRLSEFEVVNAPPSLVLQRLAKASKLAMGIEAIPEGQETAGTITLRAKDRTVREILNEITKTDPRYAWRRTDSVIDVFPQQAKDPLLETMLVRFEVKRVNREQAIRAIWNTQEVRKSFTKTGSGERTLQSLPGPNETNLPRFSVRLRNSSVRNTLNAILKASRSSDWLFFRYGNRHQYFSLTMQ